VDNKKLDKNKNEINESFTSLFGNVDNLIAEMKLASSEEILNGSVEEAQKLLSQILPYQKFYDKLHESKLVFDEISGVSSENIRSVKEKIEALDQDEIDKEVVEVNQESETTSQVNFRIPILKALIFLGGSSEEIEVTDFVKKEMKNKFTDQDLEISKGEDKQTWLTNLYFETATMIDEGLLSNEASNKNWAIAQKGIDYLSKYAK
jgi:hypothetical protein